MKGRGSRAKEEKGREEDLEQAASGSTPGSAPYIDIHDVITRNGEEEGDKPFLLSVDQGQRITHRQLQRFCARISADLARRGLGAGDKVSVIGKNSIETLLIYFGVLYHGAAINPINADESPGNIGRILEVARPRLVVYDRELPLDADRVQGPVWMPFSAFDAPPGLPDDYFSSLPEPGKEHTAPRREQELAEVVFTSGTTSTPKGVCITRGALFAMALEVVDKLRITRDDVLLEYRNYNWASAQLLTILSSVLVGGTLVLARRFSRSRFLSWLVDYGVTVSAGVPTVINILAKDPVALPGGNRAKLRFMTSSSAPLSLASQIEFERIYGIPILQMAGMTEAGFMLGNPFERRKTGAAGTPCKYKEVFFLDQTERRCRPGEEGEMFVRGYSVGLGYLQPDGQIDPFPAEGFRTGDRGYMDEEGFVYMTGRAKDLIIRGGVNIAPMEITARIMEHPWVEEAATIGVPDPIYGEEVVSFVVPREGFSLDETSVIGHCRKSLPDFKVPKRVFVLDALPKTERGKISRRLLLEVFQSRARDAQELSGLTV